MYGCCVASRFALHGVVCRSCVFAMHSGALCVDRRDDEKAFVSVNGKQCWTRSFWGGDGSHQCGSTRQHFEETSVAVKCEAEAVDGEITVKVTTNLGGQGNEESFAIDNVEIVQTLAGTGVLYLLTCPHFNLHFTILCYAHQSISPARNY